MECFSIVDDALMVPYTKEVADYCDPFSCGDEELDSFFSEDVFLYEKELLGKSYCWINNLNDRQIVAITTLSFDSIKSNSLDNSSKNALQRKIPQAKRHRSYPAVLIGRLGVNVGFQGKGYHVGTQLMDILKYWFVDENNKAACRYMLVDAYNVDAALGYYERNGFKPLYKSEESEKRFYGVPDDESLRSRILYFDLKLITVGV